MALIKCAECGEMVSDDAEACPHCGFRVGEKRARLWQVLIIQAIAIVVAILLWINVGWISALIAYVATLWIGSKIVSKRNIA